MGTATLLIFTRCIYRSVEMSQGWDGALAHNQETFLVFESIMVWGAGAALLSFHPGFAYVYMRELQERLGRDSTGPMMVGGHGEELELEVGAGKVSSRSSV